jgi:hypothetical protein
LRPYLRGRVSTQNRWIASFTDAPDVLQFVNAKHAKELAFLGTSCPDHFIRTKIRPLFVPWAADASINALKLSRLTLRSPSIASNTAPIITPSLRPIARAARRQPHRRSDSRPGHVQLRQEQD